MKLAKKLLPIATIGSVGAIVTPLVTSCSQTFVIDGDSLYIPTVAQAIPDYKTYPTGYDQTAGENLYYQNIKNNPEVLFQDFQASLSYTMHSIKHGGESESLIKQLNSCKIQQKFSDLKVDITKKQLSFKLDTKVEIDDAKFESSEYKFDFDLSLNVNIKKCEYRLVYESVPDFYGWCFVPSILQSSNLNDDFELEITANGKIVSDGPASTWYTFNNETASITMSTIETIPEKWAAVVECYLTSVIYNLGSFHMVNIAYKTP